MKTKMHNRKIVFSSDCFEVRAKLLMAHANIASISGFDPLQ